MKNLLFLYWLKIGNFAGHKKFWSDFDSFLIWLLSVRFSEVWQCQWSTWSNSESLCYSPSHLVCTTANNCIVFKKIVLSFGLLCCTYTKILRIVLVTIILLCLYISNIFFFKFNKNNFKFPKRKTEWLFWCSFRFLKPRI